MRTKLVDDYISECSAEQQILLEQFRSFIENIVPEAEETISYKIPTYKYFGHLVGFGPIKGGCSFYTCSGGILEGYRQEIENIKHTKSALNFLLGQEIPWQLIERLIKQRVLENEAKAKLKKVKKSA